ncbi:hypothetical protein PYCC9005_002372 [Savitreella phatthalungensis]
MQTLRCFACGRTGQQQGEALECNFCGSDFVEILDSPSPEPRRTEQQQQHQQSSQNGPQGAPGGGGNESGQPGENTGNSFSNILWNLVQPIVTRHQETARQLHQDFFAGQQPASPGERSYSDATAGRSSSAPPQHHPQHNASANQPPPLPFNDFFSQLFGGLPMAPATHAYNQHHQQHYDQQRTDGQDEQHSQTNPTPPQTDSHPGWHTQTMRGPGGMTFSVSYGSGPPAAGPIGLEQLFGGGFAPPGAPFAPLPTTPPTLPNLAQFIAQALGRVPGTDMRDYAASGAQFDAIVTELMNRNPQSNVRPANEAAIASIPRRNLQQNDKRVGEECTICQEEYKVADELMELDCHHAYHTACVTEWLRVNAACPICRKPVVAPTHQTTPHPQPQTASQQPQHETTEQDGLD